MEHFADLPYGFRGHPFRREPAALAGKVDAGGFVQHIRLVEGVHDIGSDGEGTVLFPEDDIMVPDLFEGCIREFDRAGKGVGNDPDPERCESQGLRNHGPENLREVLRIQEVLRMGQGDKLDRMRVQGRFVGTPAAGQVILQHQVRGQFRRRHDPPVGDDLIPLAIVQDADETTGRHRVAREVSHPFSGPFAIEIAALQVRKARADRDRIPEGGKGFQFRTRDGGDIDRQVAPVPLGPSLLPKISADFRDLGELFLQGSVLLKD